MGKAEPTSEAKLPTKKKKRKQRSNEDFVFDENSDSHNERPAKKKAEAADHCVNWTNLDFILSLQSTQLTLNRKIELAYEFVTTHGETCNRHIQQIESVQLPRLISFLNDWIQSLLVSPEKKIRIDGKDTDPCLDFRCWAVFKFCLEKSKSNLRFSPNLLRTVSHIVNEASSIEGKQLFDSFLDCFSILFSSHSRSFNASIDVWVSAVTSALDLVNKSFTCAFDFSCPVVGVTTRLAYSVLMPFANYLRAHPNPKNVFPIIVERLIEPLLTSLVALDHSSGESKGDSAGNLFRVLGDILMNGIFHPAHLDGFLHIRSSEKNVRPETHTKGAEESKTIVKSYHKHLFTKVKEFIVERKMSALGGLGNLLLLFIMRVKKQKVASSSLGTEPSSKEAERVDRWSPPEISIDKPSFVSDKTLHSAQIDEAARRSVFDVFVQFMEPLLFDVKRHTQELVEMRDCSKMVLSDVHSNLKSLNRMLSVFMGERLYVRTEDTSEGAQLNFLKEVYDTVVTFSAKMHVNYSSVLKKDDGRCSNVGLLIAKEVITTVHYLLEIEYKVIGNNLVCLWFMIISCLAVDLCQVDAQHISQEIVHLGCQLVNIYSELRQVDGPIFALAKASRFLIYPVADDDMDCEQYMPFTTCLFPEMFIGAIATLLSSQDFRFAVINAVKSIPEGQTSGCIRQMKTDITKTLDWIKITCLIDMGTTQVQTNRSRSTKDLSLQAELLGKVFSELYTLVLDSFAVSAGSSVLVGNSIKDLITTIQVSLSSLVQTQPHAINEFIISVTGRNIFHGKIPESETQFTMDENHLSLLFVFFFRMYLSCRSLYRQSISLMPPVLSKKASTALGDFFTAYSGNEWIERRDWVGGGFFSWIANPSASLVTIIRSISDTFLWRNFPGCALVIYTLHATAIQRLVDLNRQIKAFEFLHERDARASLSKLMDDADLRLSRKGMRKWGKCISVAKQEAADLTSFITGYLSIMVTRTHLTSASVKNSFTGVKVTMAACEDGVWDLCVCSVTEKSLLTSLWWLLCHNTDVWCPHATKKNLKTFLSILLYHCLHSVSGSGDPRQLTMEQADCLRKVTPYHISLELLGDTSFYEETFLCRHFTSRFCRILRKSFSELFCLSSSSNIDFNSLPDWSEVLGLLEKASTSFKNDKQALQDDYLHSGTNAFQSSMLLQEIPACRSLLNLLCWMPKGFLKSGDFGTLAIYILNIERLVVLNLISCPDASNAESHYQLFKLFACCRRALRHLTMESNEGKLESGQSPLVAILFGGSSILWLLKSVSEAVGLLHSFSEKEHSRELKNIVFSLMDHTSNIFLTLTEVQMNIAVRSQVCEQNTSEEPRNQSTNNEQDIVILTHLDSDSSEGYRVWKSLELFAETLKQQTTNLNNTMSIDPINPGDWLKISSLVSCFQGFLWGIASALNAADKQKEHIPKWLAGLISKFILRTDGFDTFLDVCLSVLLVERSQASDNLFAACLLPDIDCMSKHLSFQVCSRNEAVEKVPSTVAFETYVVEDENFPIKQQDVDGMNDKSASDAQDGNENATNSGSNTKTFSSKKQRLKSVLIKFAANVLNESHRIDLFDLQHLKRPLLQRLLKGECSEVAFLLGQIFTASAAVLRVKQLLFSQTVFVSQIPCAKSASTSMIILLGTSNFILSEFGETFKRPLAFSLVWLDGLIKYLEVIGGYFSFADPVLSRDLYSKLIDMQLRAIGRCITLQGRAATLSSHEIESSTKTLVAEDGSSDNTAPSPGHGCYHINEFKAKLRLSFKFFIRKPLELHLLSAVQALERALVGAQEGCSMTYGICMGSKDGGKVSSVVAAGVDCLDLLLESVAGHRRLNLVKRHIQSLLSALLNIVLHLQGPLIFSQEELKHNKNETNPDPGSVVLMCVEVLTKVAGKSSLFQIEPSHVGQSFHLPTTLFSHFLRLTDSSYSLNSMKFISNEVMVSKGTYSSIVDQQFSVNLYAACCKLLYTTLRHRKSESEQCIALLENSVCILLHCLEMVGTCHSVGKRGNSILQVQEGIKCATFLRRIYEEIRQQRDTLGKYSFHFLSNYISIYSGYGHLRAGIMREIDEALRPGLYALIDSCSPADLQQLHVVLGG